MTEIIWINKKGDIVTEDEAVIGKSWIGEKPIFLLPKKKSSPLLTNQDVSDALKLDIDAGALRYLDAVKTYDYFLRVLDQGVRDLWNSKITEAEFVDKLGGLLEQQMRRAWNEGMRANGLDPAKDMTDEWEQEYQDLVVEQFAYVDGYAADIAATRGKEGASIDPFRARAALWANNYTSTVSYATIATAPGDAHYVWRLGATEQHCETCAALNGVVALAKDWERLAGQGIEPQGDKLLCGGWNCDCRIELTDDDLTGVPQNVPTK